MTSKTDYDVAFSFAGEDRMYVAEVANHVRQMGLNVFFDAFEKERLWGKDLYQHFADIYQKKARFCVVFISQHYARKHWTKHELRCIQAKQFTTNADYLLPARFDDTEIPGIPETLGYTSLSDISPKEFAALIHSKIEGSRADLRSHDNADIANAIGGKDDGARFVEQDLPKALRKAVDIGVSPSVVFFDIDDLTVINKVYGDLVGDSVLRAIFELGVKTTIAKPKYFGRCGDDTFYAILFSSGMADAYCKAITARIRSYKWNMIEKQLRVSCTFGYADFSSGMYVYQWLHKALAAMVNGKESCRSRIYCGNNLEAPSFVNDEQLFIASKARSLLTAEQKAELEELTGIYQGKLSRSTLKKLGEMPAHLRYDFLTEKVKQDKFEEEECAQKLREEEKQIALQRIANIPSFFSIRSWCS
jgi:diguanylate cyclase (GGDEF)-like protein